MDDTATLMTGEGAARVDAGSWYLVLALEATRPFAGAQRVSLDRLAEVAVGRGPARALARSGDRLRLELDDRFQSKDHFRIQRSGPGWELEDLASKNGTRVRGQRTMRATLADGDVIEAGASFFVIREVRGPVSDVETAPAASDVLHTLHAPLGAELDLLARLAPSRLPILIRGESGSGKEVAARTIHALSKRRGPLVAVNCGALPAGLAESELFGARRGAYSGATEDRPGLVRTADDGTLFLDEVAELPLPAQAALLRFVQEGEVRALGAHQTTRVDVRIVAATHRDVDALIAKEAFRQDLAARLRGHVLVMPALRGRREDLGTICAELLLRMADPAGAERTIERAAARALFACPWPGNARELDQALRYAVARAKSEITLDDLPETVRKPPERPTPAAPATPQDERATLVALLALHRGNLSAVARAMMTSRSQVRRLMDRFGLEAKPDEPG